MPEPINFDGMDRDDVYTWCHTPVHTINKALGLPPQARKIAHAYTQYAWNKYTAMGLRATGKITEACTYEAICDKIYAALPTAWRW